MNSRGYVLKTKTGRHVFGETNYEEYINSHAWKKKRSSILKKRKSCEVCNSKINLHVHHLNYSRLGIEQDTDLKVLCEKCHKKFHNKWKSIISHEDGVVKAKHSSLNNQRLPSDIVKLEEMRRYEEDNNQVFKFMKNSFKDYPTFAESELSLWKDFNEIKYNRDRDNEIKYKEAFNEKTGFCSECGRESFNKLCKFCAFLNKGKS